MIKGGKTRAQWPICKVAKPQYVSYSASWTWHLYEITKREFIFLKKQLTRPSCFFHFHTYWSSRLKSTFHSQDIRKLRYWVSKYEIQQKKKQFSWVEALIKSRMKTQFVFISPRPRSPAVAKICFDIKLWKYQSRSSYFRNTKQDKTVFFLIWIFYLKRISRLCKRMEMCCRTSFYS